jgi:hypothetical protein
LLRRHPLMRSLSYSIFAMDCTGAGHSALPDSNEIIRTIDP